MLGVPVMHSNALQRWGQGFGSNTEILNSGSLAAAIHDSDESESESSTT